MKRFYLFFIICVVSTATYAQSPSSSGHLDEALKLRAMAKNALEAGEYDRAADLAVEAKSQLKLHLAYMASLTEKGGSAPLPGTYAVRLIPGRRDCLWRIAEYPFVYNNPLKWPDLWEANRDILKYPDNPNLIYPGQVLKIPSLSGENREGSWQSDKKYPATKKAE